MTRTRRCAVRAAVYVLPAAVILAMCLPKIHQGDWSVDTGWYAAIARQAWVNAAAGRIEALWTLEGLGGGAPGAEPYFSKPPLAFWIHGLALYMAGPAIWAARLPSVIAAMIIVVGLAATARAAGATRTVAALAGVALAIWPEFARHARAFSLDMWLVAWMTLAAWAAVRGARPGDGARELRRDAAGAGWFVLSGAMIGLGLMTKPLVAGLMLVPLGVWILRAAGPRRAAVYAAVAIAAALVVALPWHLSMWLLYGDDFSTRYFGREIVDRAAGSLSDSNDASGSWWYYPVLLVRTGLPWMLGFAAAVWALSTGRAAGRLRPLMLLGALWAGVWLVAAFLFPDRRPRYLLPAYPGMSILAAASLVSVLGPRVAAASRVLLRFGPPVVVGSGVLIAALPIRVHGQTPRQWTALAAQLSASGWPPIWSAGLAPSKDARLYLMTGAWPTRALDESGAPTADPAVGDLILYHADCPVRPGAGETVLFHERDLTLTRLEAARWSPEPARGAD